MNDQMREKMIKALEQINRKERLIQEYKLTYAATLHQPADQMSEEQLGDFLATSLGLEMGTQFSEEQLIRIIEHEHQVTQGSY